MDDNKTALIGFSWGGLLLTLLLAFGMHQCTGCEGDRNYRSCVTTCVSPTEYCGTTTPGQDPVKCMDACELPEVELDK